MSGIDVLETLLNNAIEAHFHRVSVYPSNKARVRMMHNESEEARKAVADLLEAMEKIHKQLHQLHLSGDAGRMVEDEVEIAASALRRFNGDIG